MQSIPTQRSFIHNLVEADGDTGKLRAVKLNKLNGSYKYLDWNILWLLFYKQILNLNWFSYYKRSIVNKLFLKV